MSSPPPLTDRTALLRNRLRAARDPALFLQVRAAEEIQERLAEVNRTFTAPAIVTAFPQVWSERLPDARLIPDDDMLALDPGAHDLVIHALCLHWANDPVGQLVQARRALRPDGLFLGVLFGGSTLSELRACLTEAEIAATNGLSPRVLPMGEIRDLGALLQRSGFALPVADADQTTVTYADAFGLMADLRAMGEGNALAGRLRRPTRRSILEEAAVRYARHFPAAGGRITASFEMIYLTGWAPDDSQQRPLRPGSAKMRLAEALRVPERPLPPEPAT